MVKKTKKNEDLSMVKENKSSGKLLSVMLYVLIPLLADFGSASCHSQVH